METGKLSFFKIRLPTQPPNSQFYRIPPTIKETFSEFQCSLETPVAVGEQKAMSLTRTRLLGSSSSRITMIKEQPAKQVNSKLSSMKDNGNKMNSKADGSTKDLRLVRRILVPLH